MTSESSATGKARGGAAAADAAPSRAGRSDATHAPRRSPPRSSDSDESGSPGDEPFAPDSLYLRARAEGPRDGEPRPLESLEDYYLRNATTCLRISVERELIRHSWLRGEGLVPPAAYRCGPNRMVAEAAADRWGSYARTREVLSREMHDYLIDTVLVWPCRSLDWCMRALALTEAT